jgi:hypothetical protein
MGGHGHAGPVGFDAADRLGGGPADGAGVLAAEVDGDGVLRDVDGDDLPGVDAAEGDLLADDHDHAGVAGPPLDGDRLGGGARGAAEGRAGRRWLVGSGPACPGSELRDHLAGGGAGSGVGVRERDRCRHLRGIVRVAAGRRDGHGCLQRNVGVLAAHRAAIDEPAAIWLVLGYGYARPAGLKMRRESTAIAGWPDHDASVALPPPKGAATRGVLIAYVDGQTLGG